MSIRAKFAPKLMELHVAICTALFGAFILLPSVSMAGPGYAQVLEWLPERIWGVSFLATGAAHIFALYINGSRWWTPMVRAPMLVNTAVGYAAFAAGFAMINPASTAVFIYGCFIPAEAMICLYRAARDSAHAIEVRRHGNS